MKTSLCIVDIKLNKTDKKPVRYLMLHNSGGYILVNKFLFVLSFIDLNDVEVTNKVHLIDIDL